MKTIKNLKNNNILISTSKKILRSKIEKKEDSLIFNGKLFERHSKLSNYIRKNNIKRNIYKYE